MVESIGSYKELSERVLERLRPSGPPLIVGIGGPPAVGKSTLARRLVEDIQAMGPSACHCPMDGFHLTNAELEESGLQDFKGRRDTFDGTGFVKAVGRLGNAAAFWWPLYCRILHEPVQEGVYVDGAEAAYAVEGNYVLLDKSPWRTAARGMDLRIFVDNSDAVLRARLLRRHLRGGRSGRQALAKIDRSDLPNAREIRSRRIVEDMLFVEAADV
ncbi:MAG: hypothetical protein OXB95_13270 [Rhodobacteraceae bacterium]|nr:hypothetical protein [Paracoccaceae bacterium]